MNEVVLVTPEAEFEHEVKLAFDGSFDGRRFWDPALGRMHPRQAVDLIDAPSSAVVVLGPGLAVPDAIDLAAAFDAARPDVCTVVVARPQPKTYELALRAGARDVLPLGTTGPELHQVLARAAEAAGRRQATAALRSAEVATGRVITVIGSKGGSGKTTVATNLATSLAKGAPGRVALVDLDLQFGDVASAISISPHATMADAARANGRLDRTALKVFLEPHAGFYALCGPLFPADADDISATTVGHVVELLAHEFDYVVVDTAAGLDEHALAAIERSSDLVLVCATDVPSVRGMRKALDALDLLGMTTAARHLVLNRSDAKVGLARRDIEATIGLPVHVLVPSSRTVTISMNQGTPVTESDPRSPVGKAFAELAARFLAGAAPAPAASHARPAWG
ncbi:MAG TPA: AAA family ATPase [Acidimicrobiales bacterium]|nr:AAA family ATPase [Acidimicrobiales bacterium]HVM03064.1 AAA family ATPase [Acidimicrobiales bacterium]